MYRQVKVSGDDATKYQRLLWRFAQDEKIKEYKMSRVTFGVSSAPYLAIKTLQQVAKDEGKDYDLAACRVLNDFYMDDLMTGCEDENQAVEIYTQMTELLNKGGFVLQKWASNSNRFMEKIKDERRNVQLDNAKLDNVVKILGLYWDVSLDSFRYNISLPEIKQPIKKRTVLSDIARLFDPLGWTAPVVIRAKILMQRLWLAGVAWDEVLNAVSQFRAWTDSTIVLAWLKGEPSRWTTFVANRVTKILAVIDNEQWCHIESAHNPADCASRVLKASDCIEHDL